MTTLEMALAEQFREPNTPFLSPSLVADFFGLKIQGLAAGAHVHRNTPTARPHAQQLQAYLQDMLRVLAAATELTGDSLCVMNHYAHSADSLIEAGRLMMLSLILNRSRAELPDDFDTRASTKGAIKLKHVGQGTPAWIDA